MSRLAALATLVLASSASAVVLDWSEVGNPGNAPDAATGSLYGAVPYRFSIGTYDITTAQYVEFLNAKDPQGLNALRLHAAGMGSALDGGVDFDAGRPSGLRYAARPGLGQRPAIYISFYNALRFANWVHNGQGSGDTETGAYTLGPLDASAVPIAPPLSRNVGARVWIPSEDEWYKAAYHGNPDGSSSGYFKYPTSSNDVPLAGPPSPSPNQANHEGVGGALVDRTTDVGAYTGTRSPYGAYDMGGNVFQWTEVRFAADAFHPVGRGIRGGSYAGSALDMEAASRYRAEPSTDTFRNVGMRLASSEPGVVAPPVPPNPSPVARFRVTARTSGGKGNVATTDGIISCGRSCSAEVAAGSVMTFKVYALPGFRFVRWSGACTGTDTSCTVQIVDDTPVQANFVK